MTDSKFEQNAVTSKHDVSKVHYEAPSIVVVGKVVELTSGPVTTHAEGTGMGFKSTR